MDVAEPLSIAAPRQPSESGEQHHLHDVAGVVGHGDDVGAEGPGADLLAHFSHYLEHLQGLPGGLRKRLHVELQAVGIGGQLAQQGEPLLFVQGGVVDRLGLLGENLGYRLAVAGGFLADVQPHQEETKGLHQADQILQLRIGTAPVTVIVQGGPYQLQILEEICLVGVGILAGEWFRTVDQAVHPLQIVLETALHHIEFAAVGLVLITVGTPLEDPREPGLVPLQAFQERFARLAEAAGVGELQDQLAHPAQILAQHLLMLHAYRRAGGVRFDEGVAIPVTTNPGAEGEEAGHTDRAVAATFPAIDPLDYLFQVAIGLGDRHEQTLVKIVEPVFYLVANLWFQHPNLIGAPQDLDLGLQGVDDLLFLLLGQAVAVQPFAGEEDAAQSLHDDPPLGFGGVGGEYRDVAQLVEHLLELLRGDPFGLEFPQHRVERTAPQLATAPDAAPALAVLIGLLSDIDQAEIDVEGAYHVTQRVGVQVANHLLQLLALAWTLLLAQRDIALAQGLHGIEHMFAGVGAQHVAQQSAKQLDSGA